MKTIAILIVFTLCWVQHLICIKEGVSYKFTRNACNKFNPKFVLNSTCRLRSLNRTTQVTNALILFHPKIKIDKIRLDITTYKKFATEYRPNFIIKYSDFICDALNNKTFSHLFNVLKTSYAKTSNFFKPCPKSDKLYMINTTVDTSKFPQFVPVGEYRIDVKLLTYMSGYEEYVLTFQSFIEVKPLGAMQF